jgi:hypothetical protein
LKGIEVKQKKPNGTEKVRGERKRDLAGGEWGVVGSRKGGEGGMKGR